VRRGGGGRGQGAGEEHGGDSHTGSTPAALFLARLPATRVGPDRRNPSMTKSIGNQAALFAAAALLTFSACKKAEKKEGTPATGEETAGKTTTAPEPSEKPPAPAASGPMVRSYTASEQGFLVGSYAGVDGGAILLIDTQLIKPEVEKFIELVKGLEGKVTTIYITHPHPDHVMGAEWLVAAFPEAKLVAAPATVEILKASADKTLAFMKSKEYFGGALKDVLAAKAVIPEPLSGDTLKVGSTELKVLSYADAEAKTAHPVFEPKTGSLFSGDLAYNNVHAWLKDTPPAKWITALEDLKKLGVKQVYPGHGEPGGPEILDATLQYLRDFEEAVKASKNQKELVAKVKEKHAGERLPIVVELAAPTYFKK
jgi:glyoxylase-like metal-dependent hydrolase (beta-lactamase superfamily II)